MKNVIRLKLIILAVLVIIPSWVIYDNEYRWKRDFSPAIIEHHEESEEEENIDPEPEWPEAIGYLEVQASALNVRETANGRILSTVNHGESYEYYEQAGRWYLIQFREGDYGYVYGPYANVFDAEGDLLAEASAMQKKEESQPEQVPAPQQEIVEPAPEEPQEEPEPAPEVPPAPQPAWAGKELTAMNTTELIQWSIAQCITEGMSDYEKAVAVNNFLCAHMEYDINCYTTWDALALGRGRCQGYANAYKNIMRTLGISTDFVLGYGGGESHGWNRVLIDGTYYYVDVTWNDSLGRNKYLMISQEEMNRDHGEVRISEYTE